MLFFNFIILLLDPDPDPDPGRIRKSWIRYIPNTYPLYPIYNPRQSSSFGTQTISRLNFKLKTYLYIYSDSLIPNLILV